MIKSNHNLYLNRSLRWVLPSKTLMENLRRFSNVLKEVPLQERAENAL